MRQAKLAGGAACAPHNRRAVYVRVGSQPDACSAANTLFDHLVGATEQGERDCETKHLRDLEIDDQLDFHRLLHRQVSRLLALEEAVNVASRLGWQGCERS